MVALVGSLVVSVLVGIANFISNYAYGVYFGNED